MHIRALTLVLTDDDLQSLAHQHLPADFPIEELQLRITPEGVVMSGEFPLFVTVNFETVWELEVYGGKVRARLARVRALGLPATIFRSMVLRLVPDQIGKKSWLSQEGEALIIDVDRLAQDEGVALRSNLRELRCKAGELVVEAGE